MKKRRRGFGKSKKRPYRPEHVVQVKEVLTDLKNEGEIISYEKINNLDRETIAYEIYYAKTHFSLEVRKAIKFCPEQAELGEIGSWRVVILLGEDLDSCRFKELVKYVLDVHVNGFQNERSFQERLTMLIIKDSEVSKVIEKVEHSSKIDDINNGFDFNIFLTNGIKVPIDIKSGTFKQKVHQKDHPDKTSLKYSPKLSRESLKNKVLKICKSYQLGIIERL